MDAIITAMVVVIALLMLGAAAAAFGADSRESYDARLPSVPTI